MKELDYVGESMTLCILLDEANPFSGMLLFAAGAVPVLMGIVWAGIYSSSDAHVVAPLVVGFLMLAVFAVWETLVPKHPLTPRYIFVSSWGRDFTAPAIALGVINMYYYAISIIWPTMITAFYTDGGVDWKYAVVLSLPQGFAITTGALLLTIFGGKIKHWQWQLTASSFVMVLFGSLMGLVTPTNKATMLAFVFLSQMVSHPNSLNAWTVLTQYRVLGMPSTLPSPLLRWVLYTKIWALRVVSRVHFVSLLEQVRPYSMQ